MELIVIGSGSKGNSYAIRGKEEILLIEAGCRLKEVLKKIDWKYGKITGCLISHPHVDHAGYCIDYANNGIKIATTSETVSDACGAMRMKNNKTYMFGQFKVIPFFLPHNGCENSGFLIDHPETGKILFLTDFEYCQYSFAKLKVQHILVEANYDPEIIDMGSCNAEHVVLGHADINMTENFVKTNKSENLDNVVLIHLSDRNSSEKEFVKRIQSVAGAGVNVVAADAGLRLQLERTPF